MNRQGFTIIELMIAMFMASIVSIALFTALSQSLTIQKIVDDFMYLSAHEYMVHKQLSDDLMGAFIPLQGAVQQAQKNPSETQKTNQPKNTPAQEPEKKTKPLEKVFFATEKNNMLDSLTFITHNPLAIYWSDSSGHAKAKRARVIYRLEPESEHTDSYKLTRQEGAELVAKKYDAQETGARKYTLATGIKNIHLTYTFSVPEEKSPQKNQAIKQKVEEKKTEPAKISFKTIKRWNSDDEKQRKETKALLPDFVQITTELWDKQHKKSRTIVSTVPLISIKEKQQTENQTYAREENKQDQQPATPGQTPSGSQPTSATGQPSPGAFTPAPPEKSTEKIAYVGTIDLNKLDELPTTALGDIDWNKLFGSHT